MTLAVWTMHETHACAAVQEARLVLEEVGEGAMLQSVQLWLNNHMSGKDAKFTQKGLWHEADWGSLRNAALLAHVALRTAKIMDERAFDSGEVVNVRPPPVSQTLEHSKTHAANGPFSFFVFVFFWPPLCSALPHTSAQCASVGALPWLSAARLCESLQGRVQRAVMHACM